MHEPHMLLLMKRCILKSTDKSFNKTQGCKEPVSLSGKTTGLKD